MKIIMALPVDFRYSPIGGGIDIHQYCIRQSFGRFDIALSVRDDNLLLERRGSCGEEACINKR